MKDGTNRGGTKVDTAESLGLRLSVSNFGPIVEGMVDLRPLTVFVGPSNSGKTYFAILIYALYRFLEDMVQFPMLRSSFSSRDDFFRSETVPSGELEDHKKEIQEFLARLEREDQGLKFSDLPSKWRKFALKLLNGRLDADLEEELRRCFDLDTVLPLVCRSNKANTMEISLAAHAADQALWQLQMCISESNIVTEGHIEDIPLKIFEGPLIARWRTYFERDYFDNSNSTSTRRAALWERRVVHELLETIITSPHVSRAHYLPAARSTIMQSHRLIASALVNRATRVGWQHFPEIPTFSGVIADFIASVILHEDRPGSSEDSEVMEGLARALEKDVLAGAIRSHQPVPEAYPEFVYQPWEADEGIRLTRASSMVSELAPIVLLLREAIRPGDLLVIEEPEAHLHPAAQTRMARILGRMVRAGLKVVITTHSDWLLQEIGNLIREGELHAAATNDKAHGPSACSLEPHEVGTWLFRKNPDDAASTVEEIPFDRIEGIEPREYEDVAEVLYNRSADLQNQLEALGK